MIGEECFLPDGPITGLEPMRICRAITNQDVEQDQSWVCAAAYDQSLAGF